jgi:hypothetical protein
LGQSKIGSERWEARDKDSGVEVQRSPKAWSISELLAWIVADGMEKKPGPLTYEAVGYPTAPGRGVDCHKASDTEDNIDGADEKGAINADLE